MTHVLLVGGDVALLEGLAQSLAALGNIPSVATSLGEARELAMSQPPLVLVVNRSLASNAGADLLAIAPCSPISRCRSSAIGSRRSCSRSATAHRRRDGSLARRPPTATLPEPRGAARGAQRDAELCSTWRTLATSCAGVNGLARKGTEGSRSPARATSSAWPDM